MAEALRCQTIRTKIKKETYDESKEKNQGWKSKNAVIAVKEEVKDLQESK